MISTLVKIIILSLLINSYVLGVSYIDNIIQHPIASQERYDLTKKYAQHHYNMDHANLINPKIIVIHHTAIATVKQTLNAFDRVTIPSVRDKLAAYGAVNVGVHYVVSREGQIYALLPTTLMGRHTIGFNHTAIGIENVALDHSRLTDEQIKANAMLIDMLTKRHSSIEYLIGHMEYMNQTYPHFKHYIAKDLDYEPTVKIDPGFTFMKNLRKCLLRDYNLVLKK